MSDLRAAQALTEMIPEDRAVAQHLMSQMLQNMERQLVVSQQADPYSGAHPGPSMPFLPSMVGPQLGPLMPAWQQGVPGTPFPFQGHENERPYTFLASSLTWDYPRS